MKDALPPRIPLNKALLYIFLSTLLVSGSGFMGWLYFLHLKQLRVQDERYRIVAVVQTCKHKEPLKTGYLAELMDLSVDKPSHLYRFDLKRAHEKLMASPLIKSANIRKMHPHSIAVDYVMREPVVCMGDIVNAALDDEGVLIPLAQFYSPRKLPIVNLGSSTKGIHWGQKMDQDKVALALQILEITKGLGEEVKQIDVSQAFTDSYGQRQIVLLLQKSPEKSVLLRLSTTEYQLNIGEYIVLRAHLERENKPYPWSIDLRIPQLAFLRR